MPRRAIVPCLAMALACGLVLAAPSAAGAASEGIFGDWEPPAERVPLPPEPKAPSEPTPPATGDTGPVTPPATVAKLDHAAILGTWCATGSTYVITRTLLTVVLPDGRRVPFTVTGFDFAADKVTMRWISQGRNTHTEFGQFSADRQRMVQLGVNRPYRRCAAPAAATTAAKLSFNAIEGTWCDVDSRYHITNSELMVIFNTSGEVRRYRITGFRYTASTVVMNWIKGNGEAAETIFGNFSADRQRMVQFGVNRPYRRC